MRTEKVVFRSEGEKVAGVLHLPEKRDPPCVIASHGLQSSKESEKYVALGEQLPARGIALLRFDFRACGESEGSWEDDTVSRRIADLRSAIDFAGSQTGLGKEFGLLGSSLGGYVTLTVASLYEGTKASVVWSTPFHLDGLRLKGREEGYPPLGDAFLEDLPKHRLLPLLGAVTNCMVIHGEADEVVPVDQSWEIFHALGSPKEIHVIESADHRLTYPVHRQRAIDLTAEWFNKHLLGH